MRNAFAGVTDTSYNGGDDSELSCCAYGQSCTIFADSDLAASLDAGRHLQAWLGDQTVMVDRYDVRLLLHDSTQLHKPSYRREPDSSEEEDIDFERYRDLNPDTDNRSVSPLQPAPESPPAGVDPCSCKVSMTFG